MKANVQLGDNSERLTILVIDETIDQCFDHELPKLQVLGVSASSELFKYLDCVV